MRTEPLRPFIVYLEGAKSEGAVLVFAATHSKARVLAWPMLSGWFEEARRDDVRACLLPETPHVMEQAASEQPHVIESPISCPNCCMWDSVPPSKCPCRDEPSFSTVELTTEKGDR